MKTKRNYEEFPGKNKFYCNGFIIMSTSNCTFLVTAALIIGTSTLFFIFDAPFLARKLSIAFPIVGGCLFLFVMAMLLWTSFSDPGIIPRAEDAEAIYIEKTIAPVIVAPGPPTYVPPLRQLNISIKGKQFTFKYCFNCKIFRPPRTTHCSICDNCVECFDHHCKMVGNCIGKRNYRYFYLFVVSLSLLCGYIFAGAVMHLALCSKEEGSLLEGLEKSPTSAVVVLICFFGGLPVVALAAFHSYMIKGTMATRRGENPYHSGSAFHHCFRIICGPTYPSLIRRRNIVVTDPLEYASYGAIQITPNNS